jgi:hypothetical protein
MIRKDILFNVHVFGQGADICSGIVTDVIGYRNNSGYPCIYNRKRRTSISGELDVILPLGILENPRPMMPHVVKEKSLIHRSDKTIADARVKLIKHFDFNKIKKISEYVKSNKSLVLYFMSHSAHGSAIPTGNSVVDFLNSVKNLNDIYRYCSMSYLYYSKDKIAYPKGDLRYIIHFIDISSCIPIMNRYKVDGMGIIFQIVSLSNVLNTDMITPIFNIALMLSNYRENLFVIDGIDIRDQKPISDKGLLVAKNTIYRSIRNKDTFFLKENVRKSGGVLDGYVTISAERSNVYKAEPVTTYATLDSGATYFYGTTSSATYTSS